MACACWVVFIAGYVAYGNRFRSPTARALTVMSVGYMVVLIPLLLRHPFGITTADTGFAWFQIGAVLLSATGTAWLTWLMVRANGGLPWRRRNRRDGGEREDS